MLWFQRVWYRIKGIRGPLKALFRRKELEGELDKEIRFHLEEAVSANIRSGYDPKEAKRRAYIAFGGVDRYKEQVREARGGQWILTLILDFRLAFRHIRKHRGLSFVAIVSLTLGIGANSALFSVVKSVLLDPLPYPQPEELVYVWETRNQGDVVESAVSPGNFHAWRESTSSMVGMAAVQRRPYNLTGLEQPIRVDGLNVSPGLLATLGVSLLRGRTFLPAEEIPGSTPVCLVGEAFWMRHFGEEADLREKSVTLDGVVHEVVGILPVGFSIPGRQNSPAVLTPLILDPNDPGYRSNHNLTVIARLGSSATVEQAAAELDRVAAVLRETLPQSNQGIGARLKPIHEQTVEPVKQNLWFLFGAVGLVLVMTCVNLMSLFLARTTLAEKEMVVRKALGAQRYRLMQPLLMEALLLSFIGGGFGLLLCGLSVEAMRVYGPVSSIPRLSTASVDLFVLGFTVVSALAAAFLFGLLPAYRSSKADVLGALQNLGRQPGLSGQHRIQRMFVIGQITLSVGLLVASGLLLRTYQNLLGADLGFDLEGRIAMMVSLPEQRYGEIPRVEMFLEETLQRMEAIPGVSSVGASIGLPLYSLFWRQFATVEGRPASTLPEVPVVDLSVVSPGFLETLGIRIVGGRSILPSDGARDLPVALVNEELARAHFDGLDPIGHRIRLAPPDDLIQSDRMAERPWRTIVGVVKDVKRRTLGSDALPEVFIPQPQDRANAREFFLVARANGEVRDLIDPLRDAVWQTDPDQPVAWVGPMAELYSESLSQPRFNLVLVGGFGLAGLILALVGVYGLMANAVSLRTREIGVRLALGAEPGRILGEMVGWGARITGIGLTLGVGVSLLISNLMETLVFGVSATDPLTYLLTAVVLGGTATTASLVPALRGARTTPQQVLGRE